MDRRMMEVGRMADRAAMRLLLEGVEAGSPAFRELRRKVEIAYGGRCLACGSTNVESNGYAVQCGDCDEQIDLDEIHARTLDELGA